MGKGAERRRVPSLLIVFERKRKKRLKRAVIFLKNRDTNYFGGVAQLVRALACHARGREFKSRHSRHLF